MWFCNGRSEEAEKIDHLVVGKREPMLWQRFDLQSKKMNDLVQLLAKSSVFLDPTLVVLEFSQIWGMDTEKRDPNNQYLPSTFVEENSSNWKQELSEVPIELHAATTEALKKGQKFVGMCNRAGVRIIAGTDGPGIGRLIPGFGLHRELELLSGSGLTPLQVLQAATSTAAEALGKEDELGIVEPGKFADLVIVDMNPLLDITNLRKIHSVVANGKTYQPKVMLEEVRSNLNKKP